MYPAVLDEQLGRQTRSVPGRLAVRMPNLPTLISIPQSGFQACPNYRYSFLPDYLMLLGRTNTSHSGWLLVVTHAPLVFIELPTRGWSPRGPLFLGHISTGGIYSSIRYSGLCPPSLSNRCFVWHVWHHSLSVFAQPMAIEVCHQFVNPVRPSTILVHLLLL
jgi:hypothetical protein